MSGILLKFFHVWYHSIAKFIVVVVRSFCCYYLKSYSGLYRGMCLLASKGKQIEVRILSLNRDQRKKKKETREQLKDSETREVAYICRYTSGNLIPNSVDRTRD